MVNNKYKAWSVTLRPKDGINEDDIDIIQKVCMRWTIGYKFITEKTGVERHAHIALFLKDPGQDYSQLKKKFKNALETQWLKRCGETIFNVAYKHKPLYNDDWVSTYLEKGDDTVVIHNVLPENHIEFYMDIKDEDKGNAHRVKDPQLDHLEDLWKRYCGSAAPSDAKSCADFLIDMMCNKRAIKCIIDDRKRHQLARMLSRYMNKSTSDETFTEWV